MERPSQETLINFFKGTIQPEEERAVRIYLAMNIDQDYVDECFQKAFPDLSAEHDDQITIKELNRVWNKIEDQKREYPIIRPKTGFRWRAYAAVIAFLILSSGLLFIFNSKSRNSHSAAIAWQKINAVPGRIKTVKLTDSSVISLFPGSVVEIPDDFDDNDRKIRLTGRAFFNVSHNQEKPFYVSSRGITTKVLGTSFEVNTSEGSLENTIILHTGKVSVSFADKEIARLYPNQKITVNKTTGNFAIASVKASGTSNWLLGEFDYEQATLSAIFHDLEQWYGIKFSAQNPSLLNRKVTFGFKGLPLERVVEMLSKSAAFSYTITQKQITIKERNMEKN